MWKFSVVIVVALTLLVSGITQAAKDVTAPGDVIQGVPNDGISQNQDHGWPGNEAPNQAIDDQIVTKYLHFKGEDMPTGIRVTPKMGPSVVTAVRFCSANDAEPRDPVKWELSGSNVSIDGPYTLIASGDIKDFAGAAVWPRRTWTTTPMKFTNTVAYKHYQLMFPLVRDPASANSMQIAEIELLMDVYTATNPSPADKAIGVAQPLFTWVPGDTAVYEDVYLGATPNLTEANRVVTRQPATYKLYYHFLFPLEPGKTYYWRIDDIDSAGTVYTGDVWSFTVAPLIAYNPTPRDGDKWIDPDTLLTWLPGQRATSHQLYFDTDQAKVAARDASVFKGSLNVARYDPPGTLALNTTYYWVVDEIDNTGNKQVGNVWSFTTLGGGGGIKGEYFNNTSLSGVPALVRIDQQVNINLTGTNSPDPLIVGDGWSARWTADLDIAITDTYIFSVNCQDGTRLWIDGELVIDKWVVPTVTSKYFSLPILLDRGIHSLRLEFFDSGGDAVEQLAWSTSTMAEQIIPAGPLQPPTRAGSANPPNGAVDVKQTPTLRWSAGMKAAKHDVYFGTDATAVENATTATAGIYRGRQNLDVTSYVPTEAPLAWNTTYYWRIDEVNGVDLWKGNVWSFTTANFLVVDDFEDYTDDVGSRIFQTWKDGLGYTEPPPGYLGNGTGSTVGNATTPYAERTIVHGSAGQSMPLGYDNTGMLPGRARYSETFREWASPQNWTINNVKGLTLYFYGAAANAAEQLYVALEDNAGHIKVVNYPDPEAVQIAAWQEWNIELAQFSAAGVNLAAIKKMYIGLGNRTSPTAGGKGTIYIDDIRIYPSRCVPSKGKPAADLSGNCIVDAADVDILANLWLDSGFQIMPVDPGTTNLVARYTFDGNTNDSVGTNNGTAMGLPTYGTGKFNQAISLDGVDDYIDCGTGASLNLTGAVTISAWIKLSASGLDQKIAGNQDNTTGGYKFGVYSNNRVEFEIRTSANAGTLNRGVAGGTALTPGVWYHVVGVYSQGNYIRTYVNGVLDRELATTAVLGTSTGSLKIGCEPYTTTACLFNGLIDDVRIYKSALSNGQIAWLAGRTSPFSIAEDLHQDGVIDFKDFAVLADSWLEKIFWP